MIHPPITKSDVGRKFRRRDGSTVTVLIFDHYSEFPVVTERRSTHRISGRAWSHMEGPSDLIERLPLEGEEPVALNKPQYPAHDSPEAYGPKSSNTEFNWDAFNKAIGQSTNICSGAKKDIEKAIRAGKGEKIAPELKPGQIWRHLNSREGRDLRIITTDNKGIDLASGNVAHDVRGNVDSLSYVFVANSLQEYLDQGGKL